MLNDRNWYNLNFANALIRFLAQNGDYASCMVTDVTHLGNSTEIKVEYQLPLRTIEKNADGITATYERVEALITVENIWRKIE